MNWRYEGVLLSGENHKGTVQADTEQQARESLRKQGFKNINLFVPNGQAPATRQEPIPIQKVADKPKPEPKQPEPAHPEPIHAPLPPKSMSPLFPSTPQTAPEPSIREIAAVEMMKGGFGDIVKMAAKMRRREVVLVGQPDAVRKEAEPLLATRGGKVTHATMCPDAMGRIQVMLVIDHDIVESSPQDTPEAGKE